MNSKFWSSILAITATITTFPAFADTSSTDYRFIIDQVGHNCKSLGDTYQEIITFETASFYVNLCQKGTQYFYAGTAKNNSLEAIFIPAYATEQLNIYQADNGNISYIVQITPTETILRIKRNGNIVIEENSLALKCPHVTYNSRIEIAQLLDQTSYQLFPNSDRLSLDSDQFFPPEINLWQQLQVANISEPKLLTTTFNSRSNLTHCP
ncbi:MAG TPA: hypothetical protein ACFCUY_05215 [Xenococcaceae cyanobacterium]